MRIVKRSTAVARHGRSPRHERRDEGGRPRAARSRPSWTAPAASPPGCSGWRPRRRCPPRSTVQNLEDNLVRPGPRRRRRVASTNRPHVAAGLRVPAQGFRCRLRPPPRLVWFAWQRPTNPRRGPGQARAGGDRGRWIGSCAVISAHCSRCACASSAKPTKRPTWSSDSVRAMASSRPARRGRVPIVDAGVGATSALDHIRDHAPLRGR